MADKYQIPIASAAPRFVPVPEFASIEFEGCLGCLECVKRTSCIYDVYRKRAFNPDQLVNTGDAMCFSCLCCVQECRKRILSRASNPKFERLGDDYWTPHLIATIWEQAATGRIPVSGAGYGGPFTGPGFDAIWTDMSEIVRPTRDGIHGREYICTSVELGKRPPRLVFNKNGDLVTPLPPWREIPLPVVLDIAPFGPTNGTAREVVVEAARRLGTLAVVRYEEAVGPFKHCLENVIAKFDPARGGAASLSGAAVVELAFSARVAETLAEVKGSCPDAVVSVRLPLREGATERATTLVREGAEALHLEADRNGATGDGGFVARAVRLVHLSLVEAGVRDQVTLLVSGGMAMAEHMAKSIICGADAVGVGLAHLIALECRVCRRCKDECPVEIANVPSDWGAQRIVNLMGSWHSQLIEVLGAMGLREVRRLRGEAGRAMFFDELEQECFAPIFGKRTQGLALNHAESSTGNPATDCAWSLDVLPVRNESVDHDFPATRDLVAPCPTRFRNALSKWRVVRTSACIACGRCAEVCEYGVHRKAGARMLAPRSHLCRRPELCKTQNAFCADACPAGAIRVGPDPVWRTFGDARWTPDLIVGTWRQAETGYPPAQWDLEYRVGASGGGVDRLDFAFPEKPPDPDFGPQDVDLHVPLNRRNDVRPDVTLGFPIYGGGMSFGSISLAAIVARARAFAAYNSFTCSGEGGYPDELTPHADHVITQVATGLFGVREETIRRAPIVEFKYAQGAKPGLGGHLLGDKVTPAVAKMREAVQGSSLFSPFPFHSVYSVEDHKKHLDWIALINPRALLAVKVSTPTDVDMVAVGSYYAGAHILHLDGSYGGTGAAPDIAKKNIAMPIEYAIPKVHQSLISEGIRDQITLVASGGLRTAWDVAKAIALGADAVVTGTAELIALECVRCGNCESGRGCPRGIATTDVELSMAYDSDWASQRLINLFHSWCVQLQRILWRLGMRSIRDLVGRTDVLIHRDYGERVPAAPR